MYDIQTAGKLSRNVCHSPGAITTNVGLPDRPLDRRRRERPALLGRYSQVSAQELYGTHCFRPAFCRCHLPRAQSRLRAFGFGHARIWIRSITGLVLNPKQPPIAVIVLTRLLYPTLCEIVKINGAQNWLVKNRLPQNSSTWPFSRPSLR